MAVALFCSYGFVTFDTSASETHLGMKFLPGFRRASGFGGHNDVTAYKLNYKAPSWIYKHQTKGLARRTEMVGAEVESLASLEERNISHVPKIG
jgi:hypothetical protein